LSEFLLFGGFPEVVLTDDKTIKVKILENIYNTYILREIKDLFELSEDYKLNKLLKALALQTGNLLNYNELSSISGLSFLKLKKYLNILSKTFVIEIVLPFYTNIRTGLKKNPKIYFMDPGFRNICLDQFSNTELDKGEIYEQFIFNELRKAGINLKFWRTKSGAEVDFIVQHEILLPIEIKKNLKGPDIKRSFRSYLQKYKPGEAFILSTNFEGKSSVINTTVKFLPFAKYNQIIKLYSQNISLEKGS
jgi:predicted AAA+ superfamily ATPase